MREEILMHAYPMPLDDHDIFIPKAPSCIFRLFTWLKGTSDRSPSGVTAAQPSRTAHVSEPGVISLHNRSFLPTQRSLKVIQNPVPCSR